jgi:hypothetical protein
MSLTLSTIREAIGAQLRANLEKQTNVYVYDEGSDFPSVSLTLDAPPVYYESFGPPRQLQSVTFLVTVAPGGSERKSAVITLDRYLSSGTGNGSSVIDALDTDPTFGGVLMGFDYEPRDYDPINVTATFALTVHVQDS